MPNVRDVPFIALDQNAVMVLAEAIADRVAERVSTKVVSDTFAALGVDLDDHEAMRATRDCMIEMRNTWERKRSRSESWRKGIIHSAISVTVTALAGLFGYLHLTK